MHNFKFIFLFFIYGILILLMIKTSGSYSSLSCIDIINSTCTNDLVSNWNKKDIGHNLKLWIESIHEIEQNKDTTMRNRSYRKKVIRHRRTGILKFIARTDCNRRQSVGKVWEIGGSASKRQFHNGFFYAALDEKGQLTGKYRYVDTDIYMCNLRLLVKILVPNSFRSRYCILVSRYGDGAHW